MLWKRLTGSILLVSYLLSMVAVYLPHTHYHDVALEADSKHDAAEKCEADSHAHHKHSHCHHHKDKSKQAEHSDHHHNHPEHSPHEHDDGCVVCQYQIQSQDTPTIVCLPDVAEQVELIQLPTTLFIDTLLIGIAQSRAPPTIG